MSIDKKLSLLSLLLLFVYSCGSKSDERENITTSTNILFIIVDDLRPELGCYGSSQIHSPHIDRLAGQSLLFERAYCQAPICNPSRMSFLSGLRPDETGINVNDVPIRDYLPDVITLPQHFKNHGYQAVGLGKVFHQGSGDSISWDYYWDGPPQRTYHQEKNTRINVVGDKIKRGRPYENANVPDGYYTDGMITDSAIEWLDRFDLDRPFFLAVGLMKPHLPFNAPEKYWDLYQEPGNQYRRIECPPEGSPAFAFTNSGELRKYHGVPKSGPIPNDLEDTLVHGYYACISYMDVQVGRLLDKLENMDVDDNTVVVLIGDHGYKLGDFGDWCKNTHYELDTRIPLLIHMPGKTAARTSSITELIDLYPTLVEATGAGDQPPHLPGTSLLPLFENPDSSLKRGAITIRPREHIHGYSIRTENHRLVKWLSKENPDSIVKLELYDYSQDPLERVNLADDPAYHEVLNSHLELLKTEAGL